MPEAAGRIRENSRTGDSRSGVVIRAGAVSAVLGALSLVTQQIWGIVAGTVIEVDTPILGTTLYAAEIALFAAAVVGLYLYQRAAFSRFGRVAARVVIVGAVLWSVSTAWQAAEVIRGGGQAAGDYTLTAVLVMVVIPFGLYVLGLVLFGIATWRAGVLPRVPAALVVIGVPLALGLDAVVPGILVVYGTGLAWLGMATLARLRASRAVRAGSPAALAS